MFMSLIICTKDRAGQLEQCLKAIGEASLPACEMEAIFVDNGSKDLTKKVIADFAEKSELPVTIVDCEIAGLGRARNAGLSVAKGEWLVFTDDDCYVEKMYFQNFYDFVTRAANVTNGAQDIRYGVGPIALYDNNHAPICTLDIPAIKFIPAKTLLPAGMVQGANMFFHRSIFERAGLFNERMGSGTPFACEDIEMAARASIAGFVGAQVPFFKVVHHHRRMHGSPEAEATLLSYDYGRGAYYASLFERGIWDTWKLWQACSAPQFRERLAREFEAAAKYLNTSP